MCAVSLATHSCLTLCDPRDCSPPGSLSMGFSRQEYWSGLPCPPHSCVCIYITYYIDVCKFSCISPFGLCWAFAAVQVSELQRVGLSLWWPLLLLGTGSRACGLRQLRLLGSRTQAQWSWRTGWGTPQHVGSPWARDQTCVSSIGRQILYHYNPRGVLDALPCRVTVHGILGWPKSLLGFSYGKIWTNFLASPV